MVGNGFIVTTFAFDVAIQLFAFVTATVYEPAVVAGKVDVVPT